MISHFSGIFVSLYFLYITRRDMCLNLFAYLIITVQVCGTFGFLRLTNKVLLCKNATKANKVLIIVVTGYQYWGTIEYRIGKHACKFPIYFCKRDPLFDISYYTHINCSIKAIGTLQTFTKIQKACFVPCIYCRVPEGRGLQKTARPPGSDETRSVNPLVRAQVDFYYIKLKLNVDGLTNY